MLFRKDTPLMAPCLAFCTGIFIYESVELDFGWLILWQSILAFLIIIISIQRPLLHTPSLIIMLLLVAFGYIRTAIQEPDIDSTQFSQVVEKHTEAKVTIVIDHCSLNDKGNYNMTGEAVSVQFSNLDKQKTKGKIWVWADKHSCTSCPLPKDTISIPASRIKAIDPETNPYAFNFQRFLKRKKILHRAFVRDSVIEVNRFLSTFSLKRQSEILKQNALRTLAKYIKGEQELAVVAALVLGHKQWLDEETRADYAQSGAMHVLAVSGLHTGIVAGILLSITSFIRSRNRYFQFFRFVIAASGVWLFALISGMTPSVTRAASMFTLFIFAKLILLRPVNTYNLLAGAAIGILLFDPFLLYNVGFQLSFAAMLGILFFQSQLSKAVYWGWLPLQKIWELITLSISAQLGTLPLTLYYFNMIPVFGWLTGIWVVPAAGIIMSLSLLLLTVSPWFHSAGIAIGYLLEILVHWQNKSLNWVSKLPGSLISNIWFSHFELILITISIVSFALFMHFKKGSYINLIIFCAVLVFLSTWRAEYRQHNQSVITYFPISKNHVLDIYWGKNCYCVTDLPSTDERIERQTLKHRLAFGIDNCQYLHPQQVSNLTFNQNQLQQVYYNGSDSLDFLSIIRGFKEGNFTSGGYQCYSK